MRSHRSTILATLVLVCLCLASAPSAAAGMGTSYRVPLEDDFDSCTGERVFVTGEQHIVQREIIDGAGQHHAVFHRNTYGTGIGTVSGATYVLVDTYTKIDRTDTVVGDTTVVTEVYETVFIRQGETTPDDDTHVRMITRITIAPDGTQTVEIDIDAVACR